MLSLIILTQMLLLYKLCFIIILLIPTYAHNVLERDRINSHMVLNLFSDIF